MCTQKLWMFSFDLRSCSKLRAVYLKNAVPGKGACYSSSDVPAGSAMSRSLSCEGAGKLCAAESMENVNTLASP